MSHSTHSTRVCDSDADAIARETPRATSPAAISRADRRRPRANVSLCQAPPVVSIGTRRRRGVAASRRFHISTAVRGSSLRSRPRGRAGDGRNLRRSGHGPTDTYRLFSAMSAKPLPRWRLVARAIVIVLVVRASTARASGWAGSALWLRRPGKARRSAWLGQVVVDLFRQLGATFIKVGQIMSTRPDLIPEYVSSALAELQDHVGPFPFEDVVRTIEADLGRPLTRRSTRVRARPDRVGVGVAGAQGAPARRPHRRRQGAPARRRRDLHLRPGRDAASGAL